MNKIKIKVEKVKHDDVSYSKIRVGHIKSRTGDEMEKEEYFAKYYLTS